MSGIFRSNLTGKVYSVVGPVPIMFNQTCSNSGFLGDWLLLSSTRGDSFSLWFSDSLFYVPNIKRAFDVPITTDPLFFLTPMDDASDYVVEDRFCLCEKDFINYSKYDL